MTQSNQTIGANKTGLEYRSKDNDDKNAILTNHKGGSAPVYAEAGMIWLDDNTTPWLLKFYDGTDWITLGAIHAGNNTYTPFIGTSRPFNLGYAADSGSANAYAVAPSPAITAYAAGMVVTLKPANANTAAATLAVSGLTAKNIKLMNGNDPVAGAMLTTGVYTLVYDGTNFVLTNPSGSPLQSKGSDIASASTVDLGAADSDFVEISGTTTITSLGSTLTRNHVFVKFQGALTLTHNATSLILPTGANITTVAGDTAEFVRISGSNWQCLNYSRAAGTALAGGGVPTGAILPFGGSAAPSGFLMCDGSAVSRSTYSALFTAIGTAYGVGDGSTTFNLPKTAGRVPVGVGSAEAQRDISLTGSTAGSTDTLDFGSAHGLKTGQEFTYFQNGGSAITGMTNGNTYYVIESTANSFKVATSRTNAFDGTNITNISATSQSNQAYVRIAATTAITLGGTGGEEKHMQTTNELARHSHGTAVLTSGGSGVTSGSGSYTPAASPTGGGEPMSLMQPYFGANYIIKT